MIQLICNGKPLPSFNYHGTQFVVCPDQGEFEIDIQIEKTRHVPDHRRHEVVVSVDGLSVMDGKPASVKKDGYVINSTLRIPGWRLDDKEVAKFKFATSNESYSAQMVGANPNIGCVGAVCFAEKHTGNISAFTATMRESYDGIRGRGLSLSSLNADKGITRSADVGTGFGDRADFQTHTVEFTRGPEVARFVVYYRTRDWFHRNNIPVPMDISGLGNPFPADNTGCTPPANWRG